MKEDIHGSKAIALEWDKVKPSELSKLDRINAESKNAECHVCFWSSSASVNSSQKLACMNDPSYSPGLMDWEQQRFQKIQVLSFWRNLYWIMSWEHCLYLHFRSCNQEVIIHSVRYTSWSGEKKMKERLMRWRKTLGSSGRSEAQNRKCRVFVYLQSPNFTFILQKSVIMGGDLDVNMYQVSPVPFQLWIIQADISPADGTTN